MTRRSQTTDNCGLTNQNAAFTSDFAIRCCVFMVFGSDAEMKYKDRYYVWMVQNFEYQIPRSEIISLS